MSLWGQTKQQDGANLQQEKLRGWEGRSCTQPQEQQEKATRNKKQEHKQEQQPQPQQPQ